MLDRPPRPPQPPPSPGAARMRRFRRREKTGGVVVTTELSQDETAKLYRLGALTECQLEDRAAIAAALHAVLAKIDA